MRRRLLDLLTADESGASIDGDKHLDDHFDVIVHADLKTLNYLFLSAAFICIQMMLIQS